MPPSQPGRQRGVAIITVMLIVVMISVGLYSLLGAQGIAVRRAGAQHALTTAASLAGAGERFAAALLRRDRERADRSDSDSPEDDWAHSLPPLPIDQAVITGCLFDLQGRFNLNNLVDTNGKADALQTARLQGLLRALQQEPRLASAIIDWVDADLDAHGADGAEDDFYLSQTPPYRTANRPFASTSELRAVRGFFEDEAALEALEALLPHVSALPAGTPINVNSATPAVLEGLATHLDATLAETLSRDEDERWKHFPACPPADLAQLLNQQTSGSGDRAAYEKLESFLEKAKKGDDQVDQTLLDVKSNYFQLRIDVSLGDIVVTQYSQLQRTDNGASFIRQRAREAN